MPARAGFAPTSTSGAWRIAMTRTRLALVGLCAALVLNLGSGCPLDLVFTTVEIVNATEFDVEPNIKFDDDSDIVSGLFPSEELNAGVIPAGQAVSYPFDCDALGAIFSEDAVQFAGIFEAEAGDSDVLFRGEEFECGDVITFRFVGAGNSFGVEVYVNGRRVD